MGNIISVRKLAKAGFDVNFKKNFCFINIDKRNVGIADIDGEMYILRKHVKHVLKGK